MKPPPTSALRGDHVELLPLELDHAPELLAAAAIDRASYGYTTVPATEPAMRQYIGTFLAEREEGVCVPFAQRQLDRDRLVGCTRLMELRYWRDREVPDEVEIGGTWLAADVQRSGVNTEAKLLLLTHAFETWEVCRVALCTDERNTRSRQAIERLGAHLEGILRNHRPSTHPGDEGRPRRSAIYSIIDAEWPAVRDALQERLHQQAQRAE